MMALVGNSRLLGFAEKRVFWEFGRGLLFLISINDVNEFGGFGYGNGTINNIRYILN